MSSLVEQVVKILTPDLGETMARASVTTFIRDLGLFPDSFGRDDLGELARKLKPGLKVFVGPNRAETLIDQILRLRRGKERG